MKLVYEYMYIKKAKGFAEANATQEDLELAINTITKAVKSFDSRMTEHNQAEADMRSDLTQCFGIRKVKSF